MSLWSRVTNAFSKPKKQVGQPVYKANEGAKVITPSESSKGVTGKVVKTTSGSATSNIPSVNVSGGERVSRGGGGSSFSNVPTSSRGSSATSNIPQATPQQLSQPSPQAKLTQQAKDVPSRTPTQVSRYDPTRDVGLQVRRGNTFLQDTTAIASTIATPFKKPYGIAKGYLEKGVNKLGQAETKIRSYLQPKTKEEEVYLNKVERFEKKSEDYVSEVEEYNQAVEKLKSESGNVDRTSEMSVAVFNEKVKSLQRKSEYLKQKKSSLLNQESYLKGKGESVYFEKERDNPITFAGSVVAGAVLTPISLATLGAGLVTKPVQTIKGQVEGIKQLPQNLAASPATVGGELVGGIVGAVLLSKIVGAAFSKTPKLTAAQALKQATNKRLGITQKISYKGIGLSKKITLQNKLIASGAFPDTELQSVIRSGELGRATKIGATGSKSSRWVIRGKLRGQDVTLTFRESASGAISSPRIAIIDPVAKTSSIYKPVLKNSDIVQRTGTYAKQTVSKNVQTLETPSGKVLRVTQEQTQAGKIGYGSARQIQLKDLINKKQIEAIRQVKQPTPTQLVKTQRVEIIQPKQNINLQAQNQMLKIQQKIAEQQKSIYGVSSEIKPLNLVKFEKISSPPKTPLSKTFSGEILNSIKKTETKGSLIQKKVTNQIPTLSAQELGFNLKTTTPKLKPPQPIARNVALPPKVTTKTLDKKLKKVESSANVLDLNKLNVNLKTQEKSLSLGKSVSGNKPVERTITGLGTISAVKPLQAQKVKQIPALKTKQIQQITTQPFPKYPTPKIPEFPFPFIFPKIPRGTGTKKKPKIFSKKTKRTPKYTASLGAAFFQAKPIDITPEQYEKLSKKVYSGLETRPILNIITKDEKKLNKQLKKLSV